MTEPIVEGEDPGAPTPSPWVRIWGALTAPGETFAALAARPTWVVALVLLLVVGAVTGFVALGKVTPESFLSSMEEQGQTPPPALSDDPESFLRTMQWIQTGAGTVFAALFYLAVAGIFLALFRMLGSDLTYRQSLATTVHGMLPLGVAATVGIAVLLGRQEVTLQELQSGGVVASNLGAFAGEEASEVTRALLSSVDLFSLWSVCLLAVGYRIVGRVSGGAAWSAVVALWAVGIGIKVALAAAF